MAKVNPKFQIDRTRNNTVIIISGSESRTKQKMKPNICIVYAPVEFYKLKKGQPQGLAKRYQ